jgi:hypothetical protein
MLVRGREVEQGRLSCGLGCHVGPHVSLKAWLTGGPRRGKELYGFSLYFFINKEMVLGSGK